MAGERQLPGLGLYGFWTLGSNGYKDQLDSNLQVLSALVQPVVLSKLATAPGSPANGAIHIATGVWGGDAAEHDIVVRDNGAWVAITPAVGWSVYDAALSATFRFTGSAWVDESIPNTSIAVQTKVASYSFVDADLDGRQFIVMDSGSAMDLTVPSGLAGTEPVTIASKGVGQTTVVASVGVTIHSAGGALKIRTQGSSATLIPIATDEYFLVGDIEA